MNIIFLGEKKYVDYIIPALKDEVHYVDVSPVMGNWETYTVSEVVSYIDSNYHTISEAGARGICGFSMGGFASINLAFRHPDVYSAVYAMSPGLLAPGK